jgi:hypothetical protein
MFRKQVTFANVTAFIALFVALSAGSYAAISIPANSVGSKQLKKRAVTSAKLGSNSVSSSKVASNSIDASKVKDGSLGGADINATTLGKVPSAAAADTAGSAPIARVKIVSAAGSNGASTGSNGPIDSATATCDNGLVVTGGGVQVSDRSNQLLLDSYPQGNNGWSGDVANYDTAPHGFTVFAICSPAASTQ